MSGREFTRRDFLRFGAAAGTTAWLLTACTTSEQAATPAGTGTSTAGRYKVGKLEGGEVVLDPAEWPTTFQDPPELAGVVEAGDLPSAAERLGQDPLVIRPVHDIGKYGGTLRRGFIGPTDGNNSNRFLAGPDSLLYWDYRWENIVPNIARGYELSEDGTELTILLRRGMRWSDGEPFTADDIMFWYEDIYKNPELVPSPSSALQVDGEDVVIEKADDYTVRFLSPRPHFLLPELLAGASDISGPSFLGFIAMGGFAPKHYLSGFLPKYASQSAVNRLAEEAQFDGWTTYFMNRFDWNLNPDLPVVGPWKVARGVNTPNWTFERNPYSIWVDTDGNQLPYIGTISYSLADSIEIINLRAVAGEYDYQDRHLGVDKLPVLVENQTRSDYKVHLDPSTAMDFGVRVNLAYEQDREIGEWFRNVDFRRALSMGIDRDEINETFFLGTSVRTATLPSSDNRYFPGEEWRTRWATLDVERANELLDGLGLTGKDGAGYRLRKDGKGRLRLTYTAVVAFADFPAIGEMLREQWKEIGIDLNVESVDGTLIVERALANEIQLSGHQVGGDDPFMSPDGIIPYSTNSYFGMMGIPFAKWLRSGGAQGVEPFQEVKDAWDLYVRGFTAPEEERIELGKAINKLHVDQVFSMGVAGQGLSLYGIHTAKRTLGNVPDRILNSVTLKNQCSSLPMTFYFM